MNKLRRALCTALPWAAACGLPRTFAADPQRLNIIVPYAAGGLSDTAARLCAKALAHGLGLTVVVENKPGANGVLGLQAIAQAPADGATIGFVPASLLTVNPLLYKDMRVDPLKDLTLLTLALTLPNVLVVHPSVPARTVNELIAYMKASPAELSYGSMGSGSSGHLNGELLLRSAAVELPHIPYKGSAPAMQDLMAGNIQLAFENLPVALPLIQSGKLRALGVTSNTPSPQAPDIPPIAQSIPGFEDNIWFGFVAPANLPAAQAARLHDHLLRAIRSDEVAKPLRERGATTINSTPEQFHKLVENDLEKWRKLIKERRIALE